MIPGFSGQLVSEFFVEHLLDPYRTSQADERAAKRAAYVRWRRLTTAPGPATSIRSIFEGTLVPLVELIGCTQVRNVTFHHRHALATVHRGDHAVVCVAVGPDEPLDRWWRVAIVEAIARGASWCFLTDGLRLRLIDAVQIYSRRYVEFDLDLIADDERTFDAFATIACAPLERLRAMVEASRIHSAGVSRSLKDGVLASSSAVVAALLGRRRDTALSPDAAFEQALTIVYRVLFLLFAEARGLVPMWHPIYRDSYSIDSLRAAAERPVAAPGLWDGLRAIARLAHAGCRLGELRVTPFNGRLFSPARTPLAEREDLDDEAARTAIVALTSTPARSGGRERIVYRDLGVEQLGAVYETLLDYRPRLTPQRHPVVSLERGADRRKATGTFYTPQPIADYIVRRTLGPLCEKKTADDILRLKVLDPSVGSGAFLVSACRFLASACEAALVRDGVCSGGDIDDHERATLRRTVAERCLYGVDVNPTAVQLARLSLWLATLAADRPLTFLDHHLVPGNSLIGVPVSRLTQPPPFRRRREPHDLPLFDAAALEDVLQQTLPIRAALETGPDDTVEQVRAKERALDGIARPTSPLEKWKRVADLWCSPWFDAAGDKIRTAFSALSDGVLRRSSGLPVALVADLLDRSQSTAARHQFFHWELEFPEAFFDPHGAPRTRPGFDAVVGNPPWEMLRADQAATPDSPAHASVVRFARESGIYPDRGSGHANQYQLFLDRAMNLVRSDGRIGFVLPGGILTDGGSAQLRRRLFSRCSVDGVITLDNQRAIFPIHRSVRIVLLTASRGGPTTAVACRFGEADPSALETIAHDDEPGGAAFPIVLTTTFLEHVSGRNLTVPDVRHPIDMAIVERSAAMFAPLGGARGWHAEFGRELNATDDRDAFRSDGRGLRIVEGKHIEPFVVTPPKTRTILERDAARRLPRRPFDGARLCYRDIASATNRMTLIAAILPAGVVSTHTLFCLKPPLTPAAQHFVCGLFNSFVVNYLVRMRIGTHVTTAIVEALPIPTRVEAGGAFDEIAAAARTLSRGSNIEVFARLNALVASLYQLSADEFRHVLGTFPLIARAERDAALRRYLELRA